MDMRDVMELTDCHATTHQSTHLLHKVGGMCAKYMTADDLSVLVGKQLQHTFRLVHRHSLTVCTIVMLLTDILRSISLQLILGLAHTSCLRISKDGSRHDVETDAVGLTKNMVHGPLALHFGSVCKHLSAVHVAHGIYVRNAGEHIVVYGYSLAVEGDAHVLKSESFGIRLSAHSEQHLVCLDLGELAFLLEGNLTIGCTLER